MANRKKVTNAEANTATQEPTRPVMPSISTEAPGSLSVVNPAANGAIAPSVSKPGSNEDHRGSGSGKDGISLGNHSSLSDMTQALIEKSSQLSTMINAKAQGRFEATEEFIVGLVDGTVSISDLVTRYGLTDDVTAQQQLTMLSQLGNSIRISIAEKDTQILALRDTRKTLEIAEQEAKVGGQIADTADAIDNSRHKQTMFEFKAQIRAHKEKETSAKEQLAGHAAQKVVTKRNGILAAMMGVKTKGEGSDRTHPEAPQAASRDPQTAHH